MYHVYIEHRLPLNLVYNLICLQNRNNMDILLSNINNAQNKNTKTQKTAQN